MLNTNDGRNRADGPSARVSKALLKQQAYEVLRTWIQSNRFESGAFLSERQLAAELGMSKTPVKAALERLEMEGLISVSPQQGIVLRELSIHEIADQFEIRLALETFVIRSLAGKLDSAEIARLHDNLAGQQDAVDSGDVDAAVEFDASFHRLFCEYLGNEEILRVMFQLRGKIHRVIRRVFSQDPFRMAASLAEHRGIVAAVIEGNADTAAHAVEEHLKYGKEKLLSPRRR